MARILAIRFSAFGDVAMTVPVLASFAAAYPEHEIVVLSRSFVAPLFAYMPSNVYFHGVNLKDYVGICGLHRLFKELGAKYHFDYVCDLHDVLRSKYLRCGFWLTGVKVAHVRKGRLEKRKLVKSSNKVLVSLKPMINRYAEVFVKLGFPFEIDNTWSLFKEVNSKGLLAELAHDDHFFHSFLEENTHRIGIAPFAQHGGKIYPLESMRQVIQELDKMSDTQIYLFGAGKEEQAWCEQVAGKMQRVTSLVGRYKLHEELLMMSRLDVMLTMDSANMHLASLCGIPTVSIWGATHPYAGFQGFQHKDSVCVQLDLDCRPCSVYGNKACKNRSRMACMNGILPGKVVETIKRKLASK